MTSPLFGLLFSALLAAGCADKTTPAAPAVSPASAASDVPAAAPHVPAASDPRDAQAIEALQKERVRLFNAHDVDGMMNLFDRAALQVFFVIPPREYHYDDLKADYAHLYSMFKGPCSLEMSDLETVTGSGDIAYSHLMLHLGGLRKDNIDADLWMRVTDVLRKIDGRWKIIHEHSSVPVDTESAKADLRSQKVYKWN